MNRRSMLELNKLNIPHTNQKRLLAEALADSHERAIFVDTPTVTRNVFARNPLPDNLTAAPPPDFDAPGGRLIQRVDALAYALPMLAPDGSRCFITLVGSFAAWCALMTALVCAGFVQAQPGVWTDEGSAS